MGKFFADEIANKYGGWAQLCDPQFVPSQSVYVEFEAGGLPVEQLNEIRQSQCLPARERVLLDIAEELLSAWSRYLCGYVNGLQAIFSGRFVDIPVSQFWTEKRAMLCKHSIKTEEIEDYILAVENGKSPNIQSSYHELRWQRISQLVRLCREYPPGASDGPDFESSLIPRRPPPLTGAGEVVLPPPSAEE
jgi:hypothetical protein